jgi:hypothetical protein
MVLLQVDPSVRESVANGELAESPRVGRIAGSDDLEAGPEPDQH